VATVGFGKQTVKLGPLFLRARDSNVGVFTGQLPAPALDVFPQLAQLNFGVLAVVGCRNALQEQQQMNGKN